MAVKQYDRITIRFDPAVGRQIRALARRKGLSVADYCRLMCTLELVNEEPGSPFGLVQQQLKESLADLERAPQVPTPALRRCLDALLALRHVEREAIAWLQAVTRASDAYSRATTRRRPPLDG